MSVIKTRATLRLASHSDVYSGEKTLENKVFFLKCPIRHEFVGIFKVSALDFNTYPYHDEAFRDKIRLSNEYIKREIDSHLRNHSLYKLSENTNGNDFQFVLFLRPADSFDLFYAPKCQTPNVVCYLKLNENSITGPLELNELEDIEGKMNKGQIYIPTTMQTFQPYNIAKAS